MKKSDFQKPIKSKLVSKGFNKTGINDFTIACEDGITKLILRIPDGKKGFILGAQLRDFGLFDGKLSNALMLQYDHAYDLAYGSIKDYSDEEIASATDAVLKDYAGYFTNGASEIKNRINEWTFGDINQKERIEILGFFGISAAYSEEIMLENIERFSANGGMVTLEMQEYLEHKEYYDKYADYGAKIEVEDNSVYIIFNEERKWYQQ